MVSYNGKKKGLSKKNKSLFDHFQKFVQAYYSIILYILVHIFWNNTLAHVYIQTFKNT
jgi:hypothetical protein